MNIARAKQVQTEPRVCRYARSGAIAGAVSVFVFTVVHYYTISNIWNMFVIMAVAGALCGACLGWSYAYVVELPNVRNWFAYNALYVLMMALLTITSEIVFEPVTTVANLIAANGTPHELVRQALPMTAGFLLVLSGLLSLTYKRTRKDYGVLLLTSAVLTLFLGLNMSITGLVYFPAGTLYLIAEMLGLVALIGLVFAGVFAAMEWQSLARTQHLAPD
jgi:hypothetical protein